MAVAISSFLFAPPPSLLLNVLSLVSLPAAVIGGLSEASGKPMQYSKFWNVRSTPDGTGPGGSWRSARISSKSGMLLAYAPALVAAAVSFLFVPQLEGAVGGTSTRFFLVSSVLAIHFLKRVLEVLFVHQYSGSMILASAIPISTTYLTNTVCTIYAQYLTLGMPEPSIDLTYIGIPIFLVGIAGNFYHHYLLSRLRDKTDRSYKVPRGGLFGLVICPHYLFEIVTFLGVSLVAQTFYGLSFSLWTASYLAGRSHLTRKWYLSKFEDFPTDVKALIPYVF